MPDDILEIKPGVPLLPGVRLNVRALLRRLTRRAKVDPIATVAYRFLYLFQEHGVPIGQIPRLVPQITLDRLRTIETLLPALTGEVLDYAADLFRIRRTWIEGASDSMYDCLWCYKQPEQFFEDLAATRITGVFHPIRALFSTKTLDMSDGREQPLALILLEKVADLADEIDSDYLEENSTPSRSSRIRIDKLLPGDRARAAPPPSGRPLGRYLSTL